MRSDTLKRFYFFIFCPVLKKHVKHRELLQKVIWDGEGGEEITSTSHPQ